MSHEIGYDLNFSTASSCGEAGYEAGGCDTRPYKNKYPAIIIFRRRHAEQDK
jgi:hypothetical protein